MGFPGPNDLSYPPPVRHPRSATASAIACSIALAVAPAGGQALEVTVRGDAAGGYVSRTSTDDAPREPIDAASMLDELPSVHIRRLGAEGSFASISVRGSAPSQVGVVLGGIPLTTAADPAFDVGSLPLWPGASMRVFRGFAPAALGTTGYLGGVLAIDLPSPATGERTEAWAAAGSFGGLKLRLGDLRRVGPVELGSGIFASRSDGDFSYPLQIPYGTGPVVQQTRTNAGQATVGGIEHASITFPWGSGGALVFADARRLGVPGTADAPTRFPTLSTDRVVTGLDATVRTGASGALHFLGWGRLETSNLYDPLHELDATHATTTKSTSEAAGLSAAWRGRPLDALTLGLVLDGRVEGFLPDASTTSLDTGPASRVAGGVGADVEWRATPRLTVSGSGRIDGRRDDAGDNKGLGGMTLGVSGDVAPTGHLGASYRFADAAVVSAHAGALERPPGFQELYGNGASLLANPSLLPERALSADAGVHGDVGDGRAAFGYEVVGFFTSASDLITFEPIGRGTFRAKNVDRAFLGGAEITASLAARGLRTQVTYTLLLTEDRSTGLPLPGRPEHDLVYDAAYQIGPVRVRYGLDLLAGETYGAEGPIPLPAHALHGVGASLDVPWVRGLRLALDVENLFDLRTLYLDSPSLGRPIAMPLSDFLGFPLPGRTVWATVRFSRPAP